MQHYETYEPILITCVPVYVNSRFALKQTGSGTLLSSPWVNKGRALDRQRPHVRLRPAHRVVAMCYGKST